MNTNQKEPRHILALSGGKDSSALAMYMKNRIPEMEYVFCDTGEELDETYEYLDALATFLEKEITILRSDKDFKYYYDLYNGVLPDSTTRWCTRMLKLKPYEDFIGDDPVISYVGIRADEPHRTGYISTKPNITTVFPFKDDNIRHDDVMRILTEAGLGLPAYYEWRSRSGCYFCFYQQKREWIGLLENHPALFEKAKTFEKLDDVNGCRFTWCQDESLDEMSRPERVAEIKANYLKRQSQLKNKFKSHQKLSQSWNFGNDDDIDSPCTFCHL